MPRAYSVDLRERSLRALTSGMPAAEVARLFDVSLSSLYRWQRRQRTGTTLAPGQTSGRPRAIAHDREDTLRSQVARRPDATLAEHCAQWRAVHGVPGSPATMCRALTRLGLPPKKMLIACERDGTTRAVWDQERSDWDAGQVVVLDETSTHTSLTRHRRRAPRGARVVGAVPRNHGPNITCLAALTPAGIAAPLVVEGAVNSQTFGQWLREWLLPQLAPGTRIVCDNLSVHKHADVRPTVAKAGCRLDYLPASSPDLNPIELALATVKTHLRRMASRTFETLVDAIGTGCNQISAADAAA